ncbi:MAG: hypothetical protein NZO58_13150, partial [Gemmataceae bacterium]|nr:hypothetical protein [Gemmataceae bacterium]
AQEQPTKDGLFISVPNPITSEAVDQIRKRIDAALKGLKKRSLTHVVFDFNPGGQPNATSDFGPCNTLKKFIRELQTGQVDPAWPRITTVAFVHGVVTKHSVLPVLACDQIVMSSEIDPDSHLPRARLGGVTRDLRGVLDETERTAYRAVAKNYPSPDVIWRMIEPDLKLLRVKTQQGERFLSPASIEEWKTKQQLIAVEPGTPPGLQPGQTMFDADQAMALKLASGIYNSRAEIREALQLPRHSLVEDWLADRTKVPWLVEVRGPLDAGKVNSLRRRLKHVVGQGANFIMLHLDSERGEVRDVATLAKELSGLRDKSETMPVYFVAWIPPGRSLGAATFLALACSEIVMDATATLADFSYLRGDHQVELRRRAAEMLVPLAREQGYEPLLFQAALDPQLTLFRVKDRANPGTTLVVTEKDFEVDQKSNNPRWNSLGRLVAPEGKAFVITAPLAREFEIARAIDIDRLETLYNWCGITDPTRIRVSRDDWLDRIAEFFREPWVRFLLIMLGIIGLIFELKMPGATFPGIVAAVCFVLFFWAYSFVGEFTLLAIFLFILGLVLIGIEIFLIPGFGLPGISGILLVVVSLVLVTLEKMPETTQDWLDLGGTLTTFALSFAAAIVGAIVLAWYLPSIPYANRLILTPPEESSGGESVPHGPSYADLLGAIGVAATMLRPAGKVQFGEEFVDVVAEGDFVEAGRRVQVIEIEGNRIVVKEI